MLVLVALALHVCASGALNHSKAEAAFIADIVVRKASGRVGRIVIMDVGANNGKWSRTTMRKVSAALGGRLDAVELVMFDPQPRFAQTLKETANSFPHATFLPHAAYTHETTLPFFFSAQHESASLLRASAAHGGRQEQKPPVEVRVRAVDLASFMLRNLSLSTADAVLFKLDIEGAEFSVLPRLLQAGALCHTTFAIIEWHLLTQPAEKRLAGLHLRHSLDMLLENGCTTPPRALSHFDFAPNNFGSVPGLARLAEAYTPERIKHRFAHFKGGKYSDWAERWKAMDAAAGTSTSGGYNFKTG